MSEDTEKLICPSCSSEKITKGKLQPNNEYGIKVSFYPLNIKYFMFPPSVRLNERNIFKACLDCGCVWSNLDHEKLRNLLAQQSGDKSTLSGNDSSKGISRALFFAIVALIFVALLYLLVRYFNF